MAEIVDWPELAEWYDAKQGDTGDLWHRELIDPTLLSLVGEVRGKRLLDVACGNGYLARRFAREGASVAGVDASAPVIALAQARERAEPLGVTYHVGDAGSLSMFGDAAFDLAVSNMALMDMPEIDGPFREVARLLRPGGRLVASLCHPCFDVPESSSWLFERKEYVSTVSRRVGRYRRAFEGSSLWSVPGRPEFRTRMYHRPLSAYVRGLWAAGLAVTAMEEPDGSAEFRTASPQAEAIREVPLHLVLEARKVSPGPPGSA
jgi:ubiquinone/menaquinone biosynthesis C-methylase UbiE